MVCKICTMVNAAGFLAWMSEKLKYSLMVRPAREVSMAAMFGALTTTVVRCWRRHEILEDKIRGHETTETRRRTCHTDAMRPPLPLDSLFFY